MKNTLSRARFIQWDPAISGSSVQIIDSSWCQRLEGISDRYQEVPVDVRIVRITTIYHQKTIWKGSHNPSNRGRKLTPSCLLTTYPNWDDPPSIAPRNAAVPRERLPKKKTMQQMAPKDQAGSTCPP